MIAVDVLDVVVLGDVPVGTELTFLGETDWRFFAQPFEVGPEGIRLEQGRMGWVQLWQRDRVGVCVYVDLPFAPDLGICPAESLPGSFVLWFVPIVCFRHRLQSSRNLMIGFSPV